MTKTRECDGFAEDYSASLDDELEAGRAAQLRAHVETCAYCESELEALRNVDAVLRAAPAPEVPSDLRARLQERIAAESSRPAAEARPVRERELRDRRHQTGVRPGVRARSSRLSRFGIRPAVGISAAAAVAAGVALILLRPPTREHAEFSPMVVAETEKKTPLSVAPVPEVEAPEIRIAVELEIPVVPEEIMHPVPELLAEEPAPEVTIPRVIIPEVIPPEVIIVAEEEPATPEPVVAATQPSVEPTRDPLNLDGSSDREAMEIAVALELDTLMDLDVIANLELLERLIDLEESTG